MFFLISSSFDLVHIWENQYGGRKRFDPVYFNGRRLRNFSKSKPKDKSKVRKKVQKMSVATPLDEDRR